MSRMTKDERQSGGSRFLGDLEPQKREWVSLTDDEFDAINPKLSLFQFHKAIEAKLKEKNT